MIMFVFFYVLVRQELFLHQFDADVGNSFQQFAFHVVPHADVQGVSFVQHHTRQAETVLIITDAVTLGLSAMTDKAAVQGVML